jgi:sirohydrochlorin ferrochelatase
VLESLAGSGESAAVVLPLQLTPAFHSDTDLPAILREIQGRLPGLRIRYGAPLGPHRRLLRGLERHLAQAVATANAGLAAPGKAGTGKAGTGKAGTGKVAPGGAGTGKAHTAVVLAAAGSSRPEANDAVARLAAQWQSARGWRAVVPAYASAASPSPGDAVTALLRSGAERVVVASYLLAPGHFADQVREQSLAAGAHAVSAPLGAAPEVADVIIERYLRVARPRDHAGAPPGSRALR